MTAQMHETLLYNGETVGMAAEPLEPYIKKHRRNIEFEFRSTACWRGYQGTWAVADNKLWLVGLEGEARVTNIEKYNQEKALAEAKFSMGIITNEELIKLLNVYKSVLTESVKASVNTIFPGKERVFAEWFTGEIRIPRGKMLYYVHMGYESGYEKDEYLVFSSGELVRSYIVDNLKA